MLCRFVRRLDTLTMTRRDVGFCYMNATAGSGDAAFGGGGGGGGGRDGFVLVTVLFVVVFLTSLVLVFSRQMHTAGIVSSNSQSQAEARWIAEGVIEAIVADLQQSIDNNQPPAINFVEPGGQILGGGAYWILQPDYAFDQTYSYGVVPGNAKLNINDLLQDQLAQIPGMTEALAAACVDWRDSDDLVGATGSEEQASGATGGAESDYYLVQNPGYPAKNSDFETFEELLLVKDFDRQVLYGEDANRNGFLDERENDASSDGLVDSDENVADPLTAWVLNPEDDADGVLDGGLFGYVNAFAREPNFTADGQERINLNDNGNEANQALGQLIQEVIEDEQRAGEIAGQAIGGRPYTSVLELKVKAELSDEEFEALEDRLKTSDDAIRSSVVNVNVASEQVLALLPQIDSSTASALVSKRPSDAEDQASLGWLLDVLDEEVAIEAAANLTTRSYQYAADIVAISGDGRGFVRLFVVFETLSDDGQEVSGPRVVYRQDLTYLGWPLDPQARQALREGQPMNTVVAQFGSRLK